MVAFGMITATTIAGSNNSIVKKNPMNQKNGVIVKVMKDGILRKDITIASNEKIRCVNTKKNTLINK